LKTSLEDIAAKDEKIRENFAAQSVNIDDFAKKTLGQIVFLYFLQKKGWFGVEKDANWGTGHKNFLRKLFNKEITGYSNFFNDILEPLFYNTLALKREYDYADKFDCKIPFLNGGLFDPINEYDWLHTDIIIPDEIFSNSVKVDPEMLGKVFENLLESKERKSKGSFYTPREIVHYMCRESLINYLDNELHGKARRKDIELLVRKGESIIENEYAVLEKERAIKAGDIVSTKIKTQIPQSVREHAKELDNALERIRVCDPAAGSGAFLVGMMNEIVKARRALAPVFEKVTHGQKVQERVELVYKLKRHAIQNCLYGVDIDPGAVEIAKLRLWLSLVVDEEEYETIQPEPAYNLQEQRRQHVENQNKLQKEYFELHSAGKLSAEKKIKLETELKTIDRAIRKIDKSSGSAADANLELALDNLNLARKKMQLLKDKHKQFFETYERVKKKKLKKEIENLEWELIEATLKEQNKTKALTKIQKSRKENIKPYFLWKLNFEEVFREKGGFDIVIANPPYIKEYVNRSAFDGLRKSSYYQGKMDIWYLFACESVDILRNNGLLTFIAQNNWVTSYGASKMRKKIITDTKLLKLLDFGNYKIFETAGIQTMVMMFQKDNKSDDYGFDYRRIIGDTICFENILDLLIQRPNQTAEYLTPQINRESFFGKTLTFSVTAVRNIVEKIAKQANFHMDEKKEVAQGIVYPQDRLNKKNQKKLGDKFSVGDGIFVLSEKEKNKIPFFKNELNLIKPSYTTKELHKWYGNSKNKEWVIYTDSSFKNPENIKLFPNIKAHLDKFKKVITSDNKPYGLHRARNEYFFKGEKIISVRKCAEPAFTYTDFDCYVSATFYVIKSERINLKYLTGILNSKLIAFWLKHKGKMQGNNYQIDKEPLLSIPIYNTSSKEQQPLIALVDKILADNKDKDYSENSSKQSKVHEYERQIDVMVYKLYGLTEEEIKIVKWAKK